jgi:hypothetical protein
MGFDTCNLVVMKQVGSVDILNFVEVFVWPVAPEL